MGARLARVFLSAWEDPSARARLQAVLRSALADPERAALLREFVTTQLFGRVAPLLSGPDPELRVNLAAAQLLGVAVMRYLLEIEPIASASLEELVERVTPALDRYL